MSPSSIFSGHILSSVHSPTCCGSIARLFSASVSSSGSVASSNHQNVTTKQCVLRWCLNRLRPFITTDEGSELGNIAGFFFANFAWVDNECNYQVADLFAVDIDLDTKRFVKAKLDDINLNAKETVILLWFNTIAAQHVKLHAMANWGVNVDESLANVNPFFRQSSVVTIMYNYFGYTSFNGFFQSWEFC